MWDASIAPIIWGISWSAYNSCARTLNRATLGNRRKIRYKWTFTNLQILLSITPYISPIIHKVFPVPSLYNVIATLLLIEIASLKCVILVCKYEPNFLQINLNVLWDTLILCLDIFIVKKTNNNLLVNPTFLSIAHTLRLLIFILSKQTLKIKASSHSILWVPMLACQAQVAQYVQTPITKPIQ